MLGSLQEKVVAATGFRSLTIEFLAYDVSDQIT